MKAAFSKEDNNDSILDMLLEKADLQGHITLEDLEEIIPRSGASGERIDEMANILNRQGVRVILVEEDEETSADGSELEEDDDVVEKLEEIAVAGVEKVTSSDTITLYLREMSKVPLLNKEQEVNLAERYEAGRAAKEDLIKKGKNISSEKQKVLEDIVEDGLLAREHLIKANTRLVVSVAKRYNGRGVPFLDLIQEGNL
ncbi:RNA polymerase subunit sigma, partial [Candidatus Bathyarchaeota archaeon]|nr:RNA polymerase subunit sigma [Candidatus Bathyarchaeota archaeon]